MGSFELPRDFLFLWCGQIVSVLGSGLTTFALSVWVYQRTGSVTHYALVAAFGALPSVLLLPLVGALVDRWNRRTVMMLADGGSLTVAIAVAALAWTGHLTLGAVYTSVAVSALFAAFRWPAYSAAVAQLIPKERLGHASGLVQIGEAAAQLLCPAAAGVLLVRIGLGGVVTVDVISFVIALATLVAARVPAVPVTAERGSSIASEMAFGYRYIRARPGLFGLLLDFALCNYFSGLAVVLVPPIILDFAGPVELGTVLSTGGLGFVAATLLLSVSGGPRRRIVGVLGAQMLNGLAIMAVGLRPSIPFVTACAFTIFFGFGLLNGCNQALWQAKVALSAQGRVFAIRRMIALSTPPLAYLSAGPLGERVFAPRQLSAGPTHGLGLLSAVVGAVLCLVTIAAALHPRIRQMDEELPDAAR